MSPFKNKPPQYKLSKEGTDNKQCLLKFSMCHDKYPMENLNNHEIKSFIAYAKKVENMEWKDIKSDRGLRYEALSTLAKPDTISKDITLYSMRLSKKFRIIGYRQEEYFYIVWFDNKHETC